MVANINGRKLPSGGFTVLEESGGLVNSAHSGGKMRHKPETEGRGIYLVAIAMFHGIYSRVGSKGRSDTIYGESRGARGPELRRRVIRGNPQ